MKPALPRAVGLRPHPPSPPSPPHALRLLPYPTPCISHPLRRHCDNAATRSQAHRRRPGLPRRPPYHPGIRRRHRRALLLPSAQQPAQRRRRRAQAQGDLRHRARQPGRGPPRPRTLRRPPDAEGQTARGTASRARRGRGQARRRRRMADRGQRSGEPLLGQVPPRARHQHPRLRAARRGRAGQAREAGDLQAGRVRPGLRGPAGETRELREGRGPRPGRVPLPRPLTTPPPSSSQRTSHGCSPPTRETAWPA